MATALTLPPILSNESTSDSFSARLFAFMYGSSERTWVTLSIAVALLVVSFSLMQNNATNVCTL